MANRDDISADFARKLLDYNPETGILTWKARTPDMFEKDGRPKEAQCIRWNKMYAGKTAGSFRKGYLRIRLPGCRPPAHHIVWIIIYGKWPEDQLDHKNGERAINRIENLREATNAQNAQNRKKRKTNRSGLTGVSWSPQYQKWRSEIQVSGKRHILGIFDTKELAHAAYLDAKRKLHDFQPIPRSDAI